MLRLILGLGSSKHIDEIVEPAHQIFRTLGDVLSNVLEHLSETVHATPVARPESSSLMVSLLVVSENDVDELNRLGGVLDLQERVIVLQFLLAGFAVIEVLTDRALVPVASNSLHVATIANHIVVDRDLLFLLILHLAGFLDHPILRSLASRRSWVVMLLHLFLRLFRFLPLLKLSLDLIVDVLLDEHFGFLVQLFLRGIHLKAFPLENSRILKNKLVGAFILVVE